MTTLLFCGDPHGDFGPCLRAAEQYNPDAIILLGDIEPAQSLDVELAVVADRVWWIPGNHDTDRAEHYDRVFCSGLANRSLHSLVTEIAGVRVAGLGGVFRQSIWDGQNPPTRASPAEYLRKCGVGNKWRGGLPLRHRSTIWKSDFDALLKMRASILVTHEAPGGAGFHRHGNAALAHLATTMGVAYAFHGHHHDDVAYPGTPWRGVGIASTYLLEL